MINFGKPLFKIGEDSEDRRRSVVEKEQQEPVLKRNLGVSFQGEKGLEVISPEKIEEQLEMIKQSDIKFSQFHLTKIDDLEGTKSVIQNFREKHPDIDISFHISTPVLSETGEIENQEIIGKQIELAQSGDIITLHAIHPGSLLEKRDVTVDEQDAFCSFDEKHRELLVEKSAEFFAEIIAEFTAQQRKLPFAVENVGQTIEEIKSLVDKTRAALVKNYGFNATEAEKSIGVTLDANHVLHSVKDKPETEQINAVNEWISKLRQDIRCFHISVPDLTEEKERGFQKKIQIFNELYNKFSLEAPVYLESKRPTETTKQALNSVKEVIEK